LQLNRKSAVGRLRIGEDLGIGRQQCQHAIGHPTQQRRLGLEPVFIEI
jgi:hypothetical protein